MYAHICFLCLWINIDLVKTISISKSPQSTLKNEVVVSQIPLQFLQLPGLLLTGILFSIMRPSEITGSLVLRCDSPVVQQQQQLWGHQQALIFSTSSLIKQPQPRPGTNLLYPSLSQNFTAHSDFCWHEIWYVSPCISCMPSPTFLSHSKTNIFLRLMLLGSLVCSAFKSAQPVALLLQAPWHSWLSTTVLVPVNM